MRIVIICVAAAISAVAAMASDIAPEDSQLGMNREAESRLSAAEAEMNQALEGLSARAAADPGAAAILREAQQAWENYRDAQLAALFYIPSDQGRGTVFPMCYATIKAELTDARAKQLRSLFSSPEGDVCAPGW
jgi:uncharacterized protein YecT (DUF1311 family)